MGSSLNRALYKCPITLALTVTSVPIYLCMFVRKISRMSWRGNGLADFNKIWHRTPQLCARENCLHRPGHCLATDKTDKNSKIGTERQMLRLSPRAFSCVFSVTSSMAYGQNMFFGFDSGLSFYTAGLRTYLKTVKSHAII